MKKAFDSFLDEIESTFDIDVLVTEASELSVISTGITSLDTSIGVGGIPRGRLTEIYGPEGSGKTTLALGICKNANKAGLNVLYIDVENMIDYEYAKALVGELDKDKFVILQPDTAEDALKIAGKGIDSGEFGLIVLDSVGALAPVKEKEADFEDMSYALVPRLITKFLRINAYKIRTNNVAFVFINQVRDNIGSYVKSYSTPGGHALKHYVSVIVQLKKGAKIEANKEVIGINVMFTITKNKLSAPFRSATVPIMFGTGIDELRDLINFSEMIGVLQKAGPFYKFGDINLGKGVVATMQYLSDNTEVLDKVKKACYNITSTEKISDKVFEDITVAEPMLGEEDDDE
jgi:recombination protein RecA